MKISLSQVLIIWLGCFAPLQAHGDVTDATNDALRLLDQARVQLSAADGKRDRLRAYGQAIQGYEVAMLATRAGLRELQAATKISSENYRLQRDRTEKLLGTLHLMGRTPKELNVLHPGGALGAARANMMLHELVVQAKLESEALRLEFERIATLSALQETTLDGLFRARQDIAAARAKVHAVLDTDEKVPVAQLNESVTLDAIVTNSRNLRDLAKGLMDHSFPEDTLENLYVESDLGKLDWPVLGRVVREFGERDAAGIARPGLIIGAAPLSLVRSPFEAVVRYQGQFLDFGEVVILEPEPSYLLVLSGLGRSYVRTGERVEIGEPIGLLGGTEPTDEVFLIGLSEGDSAFFQESLYIETRKDGIATDPKAWFKVQSALER